LRDRWELAILAARHSWEVFEDAIAAAGAWAWDQASRISTTIRARPLALRWTTVVLSVGAAAFLGIAFRSQMTLGSSLLLFLPPVMVSALYGGPIAGLAASLLGAAVTAKTVMAGSQVRTVQVDAISLITYGIVCGTMLGLCHVQDRRRAQLRELASALERRVEARTGEARAAHEELAKFCYSISHDFRAPMRNIVGSSRILVREEGSRLGQETKDRLEGMAGSANRLSQLVDDLLGYARLSTADIAPEWVDVTRMTDEIWVRLSATPWPCSSGEIYVRPGLVVAADRVLLALALRSLIENACKYSKSGERLIVEVGETYKKGGLYIFVRDNGIGFDDRYAAKIFEPFQRLHRDTEYPGTGIGLANVRKIVERHGGEIWTESQPGKGATFFFSLGGLAPVVRRDPDGHAPPV
jgi:signal transduction histidine kinase